MSAQTDAHISLVVKSTAGTWSDARFAESNRAQVVLDRGIAHFHLDPKPPLPYVLRRASTGVVLALDQTLRALELRDGETVLIEATRPADG